MASIKTINKIIKIARVSHKNEPSATDIWLGNIPWLLFEPTIQLRPEPSGQGTNLSQLLSGNG